VAEKRKRDSKRGTRLTDVANQQLMVSLFGTPVQGVEPSASEGALAHPAGSGEPLHLAQVFGYLENHVCARLPKPILALLPKPDGPADDCGWDPNQFVVWHVPSDWRTLFLSPMSGPISATLETHMRSSLVTGQQKLFDWQCDTISYDCVNRITKTTKSYNRSLPLQEYGVNSDPDCRAIASLIEGDSGIGVPRYPPFKIAIQDIKDISPGWTIGQLANRIQEKAVPR
jgi:hypothetical protein